MKQNLKLALLSAFALAVAPFAASAHPAMPASSLTEKAAAPIVKAGCYYEDCEEHIYIRRHCWRYGCDDGDYWRRHDGGSYGWHHSRYWSHNRWGSYQRYWRPWWCCGDYSGWGD
jgi:hypothetical protein